MSGGPHQGGSPDGRWLAQSDFKTVRHLGLGFPRSEVGRCDPAAAKSEVTHLAFLPGGLMVADRTEVRVYGLRGGEPTRVLPLAGQPIRAVKVCARSGRVLALVMESRPRVDRPFDGPEIVVRLEIISPRGAGSRFQRGRKNEWRPGTDGVVRAGMWRAVRLPLPPTDLVTSGLSSPRDSPPMDSRPNRRAETGPPGCGTSERLGEIPRPEGWEAADEGMAAVAIAEVRRALEGEPRGDARDGTPAVATTRDGVIAVVARPGASSDRDPVCPPPPRGGHSPSGRGSGGDYFGVGPQWGNPRRGRRRRGCANLGRPFPTADPRSPRTYVPGN